MATPGLLTPPADKSPSGDAAWLRRAVVRTGCALATQRLRTRCQTPAGLYVWLSGTLKNANKTD